MRLIDADDLYRKVVGYDGGAVDKTVAKRLIEQQPTVQRNSTQSNASNTLNALDLIYRQAAIELCDLYEHDFAEVASYFDVFGKELKAIPSAQPEEYTIEMQEADIDEAMKHLRNAKVTILPSAQPYTDEQIQKMQELEQAEIEKAFQLGREDALSEVVRCKDCKHGMYDVMCKFYWCHGVAHSANWFCADAERREDG